MAEAFLVLDEVLSRDARKPCRENKDSFSFRLYFSDSMSYYVFLM